MMIKQKVFAAMLLGAASFSQAATLYIDGTNGDDSGSNDCKNIDTACKTIEHAVTQAANGDELLLTKDEYVLTASDQFYLNKAIAFKGGYSADFQEQQPNKSKNAADTIIKGSSSSIRLFALNTGHSGWVTFDTLTLLPGHTAASADSGALHSYSTGAWLRLNNVILSGHKMAASGAVELNVAGDKLEIRNSRIENNESTSRSAGLSVRQNAEVTIENTAFVGNKNTGEGSALYADNGTITITNTTFSANESTGASTKGSVYFTGSSKASLLYNTIADNQGGHAGGVAVFGSAEVSLQANLIVNNTNSSVAQANVVYKTDSATLEDKGYNRLGINGTDGFMDHNLAALAIATYFSHEDDSNVKTSKKVTGSLAELMAPLAYNGGVSKIKSYKIKVGGEAHDQVPYDGIPFYGVGTSVQTPFISLAQARASIGLDDVKYAADSGFYFALDGSYNAANEFEANASPDPNLTFLAQVDADGWVKTDAVNGSNPEVVAVENRGTNNDQWVLGKPSLCSGLISTDSRGLPRSNKTKVDEPQSWCDIGSFEFNNYYRQDCWEEDGERPENNTTNAEVSFCFDPRDATPRDIIENFGAFNYYASLLLMLLYAARRKCSQKQ